MSLRSAREIAEYIVNHYMPPAHREEPEYSCDVKEVECCIRQAQREAILFACDEMKASQGSYIWDVEKRIRAEAEKLK